MTNRASLKFWTFCRLAKNKIHSDTLSLINQDVSWPDEANLRVSADREVASTLILSTYVLYPSRGLILHARRGTLWLDLENREQSCEATMQMLSFGARVTSFHIHPSTAGQPRP